MTEVSNTVLDTARAIARLDASPDDESLFALVAGNLGYQFGRTGWGASSTVTTQHVRGALFAHGASTFTVEQHAQRLARAIRTNYAY